MIRFKGNGYEGYVYYPETKKRNFENDFLIEVLRVFIPGIWYEKRVELELNAEEIRIRPDGQARSGMLPLKTFTFCIYRDPSGGKCALFG